MLFSIYYKKDSKTYFYYQCVIIAKTKELQILMTSLTLKCYFFIFFYCVSHLELIFIFSVYIRFGRAFTLFFICLPCFICLIFLDMQTKRYKKFVEFGSIERQKDGSSFQSAMKLPITIAQCFGLFPIIGINETNTSKFR